MKFLKCLTVLFLILSIFLLIYSACGDIEGVLSTFYYHLRSLEGQDIDNYIHKTLIFNQNYRYIAIISFLIIIFYLILTLYKFAYIVKFLRSAIKEIMQSIMAIICDLKCLPLLVALTIPLFSLLFFAFSKSVMTDEAYTYYYFVNTPIYYSIFSYPVPNNHILFSVVANIINNIPHTNILFNLRITSILATMMGWIIAFHFVKKYYTKNVAVLVVGLYPLLLMNLYYSFYARGYSLIILFFIICLYATFNIIHKRNINTSWLIFSISSILGFFTMPSFLYPFITLNLIILIFGIHNIKKQFICGFITVTITFLLYSPVFLMNGFEAVIANRYVIPIDRHKVLENLPSFLSHSLFLTFGIKHNVCLAFIGLSFLFSFFKKDKFNIILWIVFLAIPTILLIIHSVIPFSRTFIYYGFLLVFLTAITYSNIINRVKVKYIILFIVVCQLGQFFLFNNYTINPIANETTYVEDAWRQIPSNSDSICVISRNASIKYLFQDIIERKERKASKYIFFENEMNHKYLFDVDTINSYKYVIIDRSCDSTKNRKPYFTNVKVNVYLKNKSEL